MCADCANRVDQWQSLHFDQYLKTTEAELGVMRELGFNSVRLILEYVVWKDEHDLFLQNLEKYICSWFIRNRERAFSTINTINDINRHLPLIQSRMLLIANIVGKSLKWSNGLIQSHVSDNGSDRGTIFSNSHIKIPWMEEPGRL